MEYRKPSKTFHKIFILDCVSAVLLMTLLGCGSVAVVEEESSPAAPELRVPSSPAVGDIEDDGELEIVFFARDGVVYALDGSYP